MPKVYPRKWVDNYTDVLNTLSAKAQEEVRKALAKINYEDVAAARDAVISVMEPLCEAYANSAASVAARFYEMCRAYSIGGEYEALVDSRREPGATAGAVRALIQIIVDGKPTEQFIEAMAERIDYEIKRAAGECTIYNCEMDPW